MQPSFVGMWPPVDSCVVASSLERPNDPPGIPARAATGARIASSITFGRFTHIQVNVNGVGADIPGDAANEPLIAVDPTNHDRMVLSIQTRRLLRMQ